MIKLIACIDEDNAIGKDNELLYSLPNDMKHFKELTTNNIVVMGYNTYLSLPKGCLPNRINYVLTTNDINIKGCVVIHSLYEIFEIKCENKDIYIIGGASLYKQMIDYCEELEITLVHNKGKEADTYFPKINNFNIKSITKNVKDEKHKYDYDFITYKKATE